MSYVHVAVAAIVNANDEVLVALRPEQAHQGGLWEFPGGKVEVGESVSAALSREIREELGIEIQSISPLIQIKHDYPDRSVLLDVWRVDDYFGEARGMEGQPLRWQKITDLEYAMFPAANKPIIQSLQMPDQYMITGNFHDRSDFERRLHHALQQGKKIVQLRTKHIADCGEYLQLADIAYAVCEKYGARLLLNTSEDCYKNARAHGLHLSSQALSSCSKRPVADDVLLSVSCHNERELQHARALAADIVLLSPVKETSSHPGVAGIGWGEFQRMAQIMSCPVYALGGMSLSDLHDAKSSGALGIAAISCFWPNE